MTTKPKTAAERMEHSIRMDFAMAGGIAALAADLLELSRSIDDYDPDDLGDGSGEPSIDVRLRWHDGEFSVLTGDSSYDTDHRGYWGASSVGADLEPDDAKGIALDLLEQVIDHACCCAADNEEVT